MELTATLERRLELAAGQDRLRESGDGQFGGGAPDGDAEREFARTAVGQLLAELDDGERRSCALWFWTSLRSAAEDPVSARALHAVARMGLEWTPADAAVLTKDLGQWDSAMRDRHLGTVELAVAACESLSPGALGTVRPELGRLFKALPYFDASTGDLPGLRRRLESLVPPDAGDTSRLPRSLLDDDDPYGPRMRAEHGPLLASSGVAAFLAHCATLDKPRATVKWRKETARLLAAAPAAAEVTHLLLEEFARQPEGRTAQRWSRGEVSWQRGLTGTTNTALVRGLLWSAAGLEAAWVVPVVGSCALNAGIGQGGSGGMSRCAAVATAAVAVLASFDGEDGEQAVRALAAVRAKVRNRTVLKGAERGQLEIAARAGLTPGQLRERSVPSAGLDARRIREVALGGGYTAVLAVDGAAAASLAFRNSAGRMVRSSPKAVKESCPDELAALRKELKELRGLLSAERSRLEEFLAGGPSWTGADWQRYYADHPVTGALTGLLLWEVRAAGSDTWTAGLPERGGAGWSLAGTDGTAAAVGADDRVRLWHPLPADPEEVRAWRGALTEREVGQPFKQVFREVYLLTPAEETTATYSNRFAAHILRFPQARSLMAARGWVADHLGYYSDGYTGQAVRVVATAEGSGWRARFSYRLVEREEDGWVVSLCSTDQVRFERRAPGGTAWRAADLVEVPPLVLSETLRDVDLFVGVTSIAADPLWQDGGDTRHEDYWQRTAFGELPASAQIRKEALVRLLPRTRIADRVELDGRFLRVRGELGAYRIHIGSGNVLVEPNDAYLCIVPTRGANGAGGRVFLPFEEDGGMLSVVLSKAFLLADDASITDPSSLRQLAARAS